MSLRDKNSKEAFFLHLVHCTASLFRHCAGQGGGHPGVGYGVWSVSLPLGSSQVREIGHGHMHLNTMNQVMLPSPLCPRVLKTEGCENLKQGESTSQRGESRKPPWQRQPYSSSQSPLGELTCMQPGPQPQSSRCPGSPSLQSLLPFSSLGPEFGLLEPPTFLQQRTVGKRTKYSQ